MGNSANVHGAGMDELKAAIVKQAVDDYRSASESLNAGLADFKQLKEIALSIGQATDAPHDDTEMNKLILGLRKLLEALKTIRQSNEMIQDIEQFFGSEWYKTICDIDPKKIMKKLKEEAKNGAIH